jgi:single-strand DNA-binding protein
MNKVVLTGRVGRTPEVRSYENGSKTTKFSLATTDGYGDKKEVNWHNIVIWGEYGETMSKYINVGNQICVSGKITNSSYEKDGVKTFYTAIICDQVELLDKKSESSDDIQDSSNSEKSVTQKEKAVTQKAKVVTPLPASDDDLPF